MTEQDQTPDIDDTEGHFKLRSPADGDDTEGDDTEGHFKLRN